VRSGASVLLVVFDGVQSLDLTGPLEVFSGAGHAVSVASPGGAPVRTSSGLALSPDADLYAARGPLDTLLVAGGAGARAAVADAELVGWLREAAPRARRVASVCTGAFLLAEAGLLDGRRATTHWAWCAALAARHPAVEVDPEPIFVRDGAVWTSAGVTAGLDLALALVEEDVGRRAALEIARDLVLFLRRPGGQAQFSAQLGTQLADRDELRDLQHWIGEHLDADLGVEALAGRAAMSPRHFARAFAAQVGVTPARYVARVRVEAARRRLEESADPVESIAAACGFGTPETLRRAFHRAFGVAPAEYRHRFARPERGDPHGHRRPAL
jgi:transcriptional regulator GlxA family with amidase domain